MSDVVDLEAARWGRGGGDGARGGGAGGAAAQGADDGRLVQFGANESTRYFDRGSIRAALSLLCITGLAEERDGALYLLDEFRGLGDGELYDAMLRGLAERLGLAGNGTTEQPLSADGGQGAGGGRRGPTERLPWSTVALHGTFRIPPGPGRMAFASLRAVCSAKGRRLGRRFRCHEYPDGTFEVWREL